ncbi:MAG: DNA starvation/stationary phase protection protein [Anaerolineae bacterium]|jgi:starvation-inducible DNA-binding protein|nr:DNA starvation/stationary phase protection protein [Anaerolineae bacterium]
MADKPSNKTKGKKSNSTEIENQTATATATALKPKAEKEIEKVETETEEIENESENESENENENDGQGVAQILCTVLADEVLLYTKLRKFHWNVTGESFFALHEAFEKQYDEVAIIVDEVAERIRVYGAVAPGTLVEFQNMTRLTETPGVNPDARGMVAELVADYEMLIEYLNEDIEEIDDEFDDVGAEDLLTGILRQHQKQLWMLRSFLQ